VPGFLSHWIAGKLSFDCPLKSKAGGMYGGFAFSKAQAAEKQFHPSGFRPENRRFSGNRRSPYASKIVDF